MTEKNRTDALTAVVDAVDEVLGDLTRAMATVKLAFDAGLTKTADEVIGDLTRAVALVKTKMFKALVDNA
jgi:hypothetical protein